MRKKLLMLFIRLIRLFRKEDQLMPNLLSVSKGEVIPGRLYRHFGRVLVARENPEKVTMRYFYASVQCKNGKVQTGEWKQCDESMYNIMISRKDFTTRYEQEGAPCSKCACEVYSLPCHCAFRNGARTGYFEQVSCSRQYTDNPTI